MQWYAAIILLGGWVSWIVPFVKARRTRQRAQQIDRRARWGMILIGVSYALIFFNNYSMRPVPPWRLVAAFLFFVPADLLAWTAPRALGRQWRVEAGLNESHELVTIGPYAIVRHPIYTSMIFQFLGVASIVALPVPFVVALGLFLAGTEIRVRVEEQLLAERFGEVFENYRRRVPAFLPFIR